MYRSPVTVLTTLPFVADPASVVRHQGGARIDWTLVTTTNAAGKKYLPAGKAVGYSPNGGVAPRSGTVAAVGVLETDAVENEPNAPKTGYGVIRGALVYENRLPDSDNSGVLPAAIKTELATNGAGFAYQTYRDSLIV